MNLAPHPAADVFPMMSDSELTSLAADIKKAGQVHPIIVIDVGGAWQILDGRNRYEACKRAGVHPRTEVFSGKDPIAFVWSANCERRHLTEAQRAMIGERFATLKHGSNQHHKVEVHACTSTSDGATRADAANLVGVSERSVSLARRIRKQGVPELVSMVEGGSVSLRSAERVVALPEEEQRLLVSNGPAAIVERANRRDPEPPAPRLVVHNGGVLHETEREGVFQAEKPKLYDLSAQPNWRTRHEDHAAVLRCLAKGMRVADIVETTGLESTFVHHSMAPYRIRPKVMDGVIEDMEVTAESWASWATRIEQKWPGASRTERDALIEALESCRRSAAAFIRELKKDARTGEAQ